MTLSAAAMASLVALGVVIVVSCFRPEMNPGILSIFFALVVGAGWSNLAAAKILGLFPAGLFMMLVGITFMFAMAQTNGTMTKITSHTIRLVKGKTVLIPFVLFLLIGLISASGPGNPPTVALMAPVCMAVAGRIGLSAFCMTLIIAAASQGFSFSPFAPSGIVSNGIIAKIAPELPMLTQTMSLEVIGWKIFFESVFAQSVVNLTGFFLLGGWSWIRRQREQVFDINDIAPKPEPFTREQKLTLAAILCLIVLGISSGIPAIKSSMPKAVLNLSSNVGGIAYFLAGIMMLLKVADVKESLKSVPWGVIMMVCGITVLIEVMDKAGGLNAIVQGIDAISGPVSVNFWLGLFTGILSAYSSSIGVVMPMFLPLVPKLVQTIGGGADPLAMISTINVGSFLVDTSPLSTLGALCISCADPKEDRDKLFRNLLIWGLSMSVVGAVVCWLFFGVLKV